jgi:TonB family protein
MGLPRAYSGNFAVAFRFDSTGKSWAVRCFTRQIGDVQRRYEAISRFCEANPDPALCFFEYQERGIAWRGAHLPIVKMEWAEGETLGKWLTRHHSDAWALRRVAEGLAQIAERLERRGAAHGDLQHGNLMITSGLVRLIDYDGMFVPGLQGLDSPVLGHRNYQHPARTEAQFDARMDRFSILVIFIGLTALAADSTRFTRYGCDERVLFERRDFENPDESDLFHELAADATVGNWTLALAEACRRPPTACPALLEVLDGSYLARIGPVALGRKTTAVSPPPIPPPQPSMSPSPPPPQWQPSAPQAQYSAMPGSAVPFVQVKPHSAKRGRGGLLVAGSIAALILAAAWHPWSQQTHDMYQTSTARGTTRTGTRPATTTLRAFHRPSVPHYQKQPRIAPVITQSTPRAKPHAQVTLHQAVAPTTKHRRIAHAPDRDASAARDIESMALGTPMPSGTESTADISDMAQRRSTPQCTTPSDDAAPVQLANPETPESLQGATASAIVRVSLDTTGRVISATIVRSTGDASADAAALAAAHASTFRPGHKNCEPVAGEYLVNFDFE